jgi:hypothetical protein
MRAPQAAWFDDWRMAAASATGASHLARATENQDSFQTNVTTLKDPTRRDTTRNEPLIICVADGLGTNRHSAAGAALATAFGQMCTEAVFACQQWHQLSRKSIEGLLGQSVEHVRRSWLATIDGAPARNSAESRQDNASHPFHTTLILTVLRPPWLAIAQVGDGFVVAQNGDGRCVLLDGPRPSYEYVNMVTTLGQPQTAINISVVYDRNIRGVAVSTDGLEDSVLSCADPTHRAPKEDFFGTMFAEVASGERDSERTLRLLRSPALRAQTDDDLTLVVASRSVADRD